MMRDSQKTAYREDTRTPSLRLSSEYHFHLPHRYLLVLGLKSTHLTVICTAMNLAPQISCPSLHRNTLNLQHPPQGTQGLPELSAHLPRLHQCRRIRQATLSRGTPTAQSRPALCRADHPSPDTRHRTRSTPVVLIHSLLSASLPRLRHRPPLLLLREAGTRTSKCPTDLLHYRRVLR
jgi:hypothetical protein